MKGHTSGHQISVFTTIFSHPISNLRQIVAKNLAQTQRPIAHIRPQLVRKLRRLRSLRSLRRHRFASKLRANVRSLDRMRTNRGLRPRFVRILFLSPEGRRGGGEGEGLRPSPSAPSGAAEPEGFCRSARVSYPFGIGNTRSVFSFFRPLRGRVLRLRRRVLRLRRRVLRRSRRSCREISNPAGPKGPPWI